MNKKFFVILSALIFIINSAFAQSKKTYLADKKAPSAGRKAVPNNQLAANLPASEAVVTIQMSRLMNEAMPQILSVKPEYLREFNAKIDEIKTTIGIDLRQFDELAAGISYKAVSAKETDFDPLILARGKFNSGAFLGLAKIAAKGKYREEKIGERTVYIFSPKEILAEDVAKAKNSTVAKWLDQLMKGFKKEIAVTSFNENTLAMGSIERVRQVFDSKERISQNVLSLASRNPQAIFSFGANMPAGAAQFLPVENDELGKNIASIRQMFGALDMKEGKALLSVSAQTAKNTEAQSLEETLSGLQMVGKALLGGSQREDQKLYSRLLENAVISRKTNEVSLNLTIPKTDMNALMAILLK